MNFFKKMFKKVSIEDIIFSSCKKNKTFVKLIKGNYEFAIRNFKLLNNEYIDIVGDMNQIEFIFINKGKIIYIDKDNYEKDPIKYKIYESDECPVCCEEENIKYLTCGHAICEDCSETIFKTYEKNNRNCPICKAKMIIYFKKFILPKKRVPIYF